MTTAASQYCGPCQKWAGIASTTMTHNWKMVAGKLVAVPVTMHVLTCGHVWMEKKP